MSHWFDQQLGNYAELEEAGVIDVLLDATGSPSEVVAAVRSLAAG